MKWFVFTLGVLLLLAALAVLYGGLSYLAGHDYVASVVLTIVGLSLLGAGVELTRPALGE